MNIKTFVGVNDDFASTLNEQDKQQAARYSRFRAQGKLNKKCSNIIPTEMRNGIDFLLENRHLVGVDEDCQFLFANSKGKRNLFFSAFLCLKNICEANQLDFSKFSANKLRKHLATSTAALNDTSQNVIYDFMGHTKGIHKDVYQQIAVNTDVIMMSKILEDAAGMNSKFANNSVAANHLDVGNENEPHYNSKEQKKDKHSETDVPCDDPAYASSNFEKNTVLEDVSKSDLHNNSKERKENEHSDTDLPCDDQTYAPSNSPESSTSSCQSDVSEIILSRKISKRYQRKSQLKSISIDTPVKKQTEPLTSNLCDPVCVLEKIPTEKFQELLCSSSSSEHHADRKVVLKANMRRSWSTPEKCNVRRHFSWYLENHKVPSIQEVEDIACANGRIN